MKSADREELWERLMGRIHADAFPIIVGELDKAVRRARREERRRLMTCECGRVCTGPVQCAVCGP